MEKPYRENMHAIACLFCAELAEGKGRFVPQIADGVFHFCEMSSWALSAHLCKFSQAKTAMPVKDDNTLELHQGDYVVTARKAKGSGEWFVGGVTDENAREMTVSFDFLEPGKKYVA